MIRIFTLIFGLSLAGPSFGTWKLTSGVGWESFDLITYSLACQQEGCVLVSDADQRWNYLASSSNAIYSQNIRERAIANCKIFSKKPLTCRVVDEHLKSDFIRNFSNINRTAEDLLGNLVKLKECFATFHFGPPRGVGQSWHEYVTYDNHFMLNRGDCDAYVSDDYARWIGPMLEDDRLNASNLNRIYSPFDVDKVASSPASNSTPLYYPNRYTKTKFSEQECFDEFHNEAGRRWVNFVRWGTHDYLEAGDCDEYVSEDRSAWIGGGGITADVASQDMAPSNSSSSKESLSGQPLTTEADKNLELEFWQSIKGSDDPDMYREYLRQFPSGVYVGLAKIKLKKFGGDTTVANAAIPNLDYGDYYALVIGNNNYPDLNNLRSAVSDARVVSTVLEVDYGFNVKLLEDASRKDILRGLKSLRESVGAQDNVLIYYAGHGYLDEAADKGYWLPVDSERDDDSNWILTDRVASQVKAMKAKHVMVVADSCFSGTITRAIKIDQRTPQWLSEIVNKKARTALTSGGLEPVMDTGSGNHSAFAHAFISLLEENEGVLDASQLFSELRPKVMANSTQTPQYGKIHMAGDDGGDFLFVSQ